MLEQLRVDPGTPPRLADRETDDHLGLDKDEGNVRLEHLVERIDELQYRLFAEDAEACCSSSRGSTRRERTVSSDACSTASTRQASGSCRSGRRPAPSRSTTTCGGSRRAAAARRDRRLQPLALRGRRRGPDASSRPSRSGGAAGASRRVRAHARRRGDDARQGVPQRLPGRAERAVAGADRGPGETLEVPARRPEGARRFDDWVQAWDEVLGETSTDHAPWYVVPADRNWVKALAWRRWSSTRWSGSTRSSRARAGGCGPATARMPAGAGPGRDGYRGVGSPPASTQDAGGGNLRRLGRAPARHERGGRVQVDLDVRRDDRRRVEVVPRPTQCVEAPGQHIGRLVHMECLELGRSHSFPLS